MFSIIRYAYCIVLYYHLYLTQFIVTEAASLETLENRRDSETLLAISH